jgi:hypothetical protein
MPAVSSCRSPSSFTCLPHEGGTIHLLRSRPYAGFATEPKGQAIEILAQPTRRAIASLPNHGTAVAALLVGRPDSQTLVWCQRQRSWRSTPSIGMAVPPTERT